MLKIRSRTKVILFAALSVLVSPFATGDVPDEAELQSLIETARAEFDLVGLGAVIAFADGEIVGPTVSGERVKGSGDLIEPGDAWHIGSNTKMLTALLYGRLAEQGMMSWGATVPELFPDLADRLHDDWQTVTIEDLMAHRSGLAANPGLIWFLTSRGDDRTLRVQRAEIAEDFLTKPVSGEKGEFVYSNLGFMLAGAAIEAGFERATGEDLDYEDIFRRVLLSDFSEAGSWGFGPPDEIVGHGKSLFGGMTAKGKGPAADNPAALGPAGTAHIALEPHARFLAETFLDSDDPIIARILQPYPDDTADYALGVGVRHGAETGRIYSHSGSNTIFLHRVLIAPDDGYVLLIATNQMSDDTVDAINSIERRIRDLMSTD